MSETCIEKTGATITLGKAPAVPSNISVGVVLVRAFDRLLAWQDRMRSRHILLSMDDRMLRDIGISRCDAEQEGVKPFWR